MSRRPPRLDQRLEDLHFVSDDLDVKVRIRPTPEAVARLWDSHHGWEACNERWGWIGRHALSRMAVDGRRLLRAAAGECTGPRGRRSTTVEQETAAFDLVGRIGICHAAEATGLCISILYRILRERGVERAPRRPAGERSQATREGIARARAAKAAA